MNLEKQNKSDDDIKKINLTANNRYFTICIYTMFVIFFGAIHHQSDHILEHDTEKY